MKLLDASVAVKFALEEPGAEAAQALLNEPLCAPELILVEAANAWWKAHRKNAISADAARNAVRNLTGVFDSLLPVEPIMDRAMELALTLEHPAYDCVYLAYACELQTPVITADRRFLRLVERTEWEQWCSPLESI